MLPHSNDVCTTYFSMFSMISVYSLNKARGHTFVVLDVDLMGFLGCCELKKSSCLFRHVHSLHGALRAVKLPRAKVGLLQAPGEVCALCQGLCGEGRVKKFLLPVKGIPRWWVTLEAGCSKTRGFSKCVRPFSWYWGSHIIQVLSLLR